MPRHPQRFWLAALLVAWSVDFLFWEKPAGISFLIFIVLALAGGYFLSRGEIQRPARSSLVLSGLIVIMALITVLRSEPFTRLLNGMLALGGLALLVLTFRGGGWMRYGMLQFITGGIELLVAALSRAFGLRLASAGDSDGRRAFWHKGMPVLRGVLLALPVVIGLAALLASADLIFAGELRALLKYFDLARLPEYILRFSYILVLTYALAGLYLQAVFPRSLAIQEANALTGQASLPEDAQKPALPAASGGMRILGAVEAFIVLGSVDLLFAFFVGIQARYLFGGQANITAAGYTYSEYARRGFFELVWVAVISLLLYLALNTVTRRIRRIQEQVFTGLSVLLVGLVLAILASAFQRLTLYESAYGFTSLRTYTHIFIPWLGLLLVGTIALQILRREAYFTGLLLLILFGFAVTFGVVNVDGFIVRQNVARARAGAELDSAYLLGLSDDAIPALVQEYNRAGQPQTVRDALGAGLACRVNLASRIPARPWQSYHPGSSVAWQSLSRLDLSAYPVRLNLDYPYVALPGGTFECVPHHPGD